MKKSTLSSPKFSTSLSEGSLGKAPKLPSTTPSVGTNGRNTPYSTLLPAQIHDDQINKLNKSTLSTIDGPEKHPLPPPSLPNSSMHAIYKMITKLPFEVRERVTSIVNMALFTADNSQKQYDGLKLEHITLKNQHKKKMLECDHLTQRCEIFREQISKLEEKLGALQDDAESRQTYAIRNSKAISRLSSTNKTLIDAFALLTDGHPPSANQHAPKSRSMSHRSTQRRKGNLLTDMAGSRASSPDEFPSSNPPSPQITQKSNHQSTKGGHANSNQEVSVTKNEKLRERLLRVAKDHNRVVKNLENLESKIQGLRSSLRYAERRNRQLQLELDEIRENQSLDNASLHKNAAEGENNERRGNSGASKHEKDRMDTRLSVLVNRNAFDPMDGIKYMDSMIAHLAATPSNLVEEDVAKHLCSRNACNLFETERISIYILQPGGKIMNRYITNSSRVDRIKLGEQESIAENILHHGLIRRYNNLKQTKNLYYNPEVDSAGDVSLKRILSVPLREMGQGRIIGVCQLLNKRDNNKFSEVDELYATAYGEMCGGLVSGSILFRRVWNESAIISGLIQAPYHLLDAVPVKETLCSSTPLSIVDVLFTMEHVARDALKCFKVKCFLITPEELDSALVYSLHEEAITMMTMKSSQLTLKTSSKHSGVAGHVISTMKSYLVVNSSFDPWVNPEVDMDSAEHSFYTVPIINFENKVIGCLQLTPSPNSPNISSIQDKIEPLALSFEKSADWLAYSLSSTLWSILQYVGKPSARPDIRLNPITLTEKLATMPLSIQPTVQEGIRKRRATIIKSVSMAEESSHLPGGGLYEKHTPGKSSSKDDDLRDFLLQFPDYEQHQQQHANQGVKETSSGSRSNASNQGRTSVPPNNNVPFHNAGESLDTQRSSSSNPLVSPKLSQTPSADNPISESDLEKMKAKYEKEVSNVKSELFFTKEKYKTEVAKLNNEIADLKESQKIQTKSEIQSLEQKYEENLREYKAQFEDDLRKLRKEKDEEKQLLQKNIQQLEVTIQNLHAKLTFVDKPIDTKNFDVVGTLEVTQIHITALKNSVNGSEAIIQVKLGDGSNWSHLSQPQQILGHSIQWNSLQFSGKISQAQLPIDTLSLRIKEKSGGAVKLIGVANLNISALISQTNQWVTLTGDLLDKDGKSSTQGSYTLRMRYYRDDQEPQEDKDILTVVEERGFFQANTISFVDLPTGSRKNLFVECQLKADQEWSHLTDVNNFPDNSSEITWNHLSLTGNIAQQSLKSGLLLTLKQHNLPDDIILGTVEMGLSELVVRTNEWVNMGCVVRNSDGKECGKCVASVRYRREDQEESTEEVKEVTSADPPIDEELNTKQSSKIIAAPSTVTPPEVLEEQVLSSENEENEEKRDEQQSEIIEQSLEHDEVAEVPIDTAENIEERPPPTPTKEEVSNSPRIGSWAQMKDEDGNIYYYNTITGETSWHPPEEMALDGISSHQHETEGQIRNGDWIQLQDDGGNFYWYNEVTGESSWELPVEDPELYAMPDHGGSFGSHVQSGGGGGYASASAGGYTIEL